MNLPLPLSPANRYDATRAPYDDAGPWDKTVRYTRARTKILRRGCDPAAQLVVERQDGMPVLCDPNVPGMSEAL